MMPESVRFRFELWAQTRQHQWRVRQAGMRVDTWLERVQNPYVAFSTGKDSLCVLSIVRQKRPSIPAVYFDADCAFPESKDLMAFTSNLIVFPTAEPLLETFRRCGGFDGDSIERETMKTTVYEPIKQLIDQYDFDGVCYGLRSQESRARRLNAKVRGPVFQYKRDGLWACQPIYDWIYDDVWAYIVSHELAYCGTYDRMWDMPEEDQRLSYWAGETKRRWGRWAWLKRNYPDLFNRLAAEFPEARSYV
jgi:3'-phosphoadenosine 5'-phosphosulfate sulfotransferase (PAPS reductase)/FAD synthetase